MMGWRIELMTTTLTFHGDDLRGLFDILVEAVEVTSREGVRPAIEVNGKLYPAFDLVKVAALLPYDQELQQQHQAIADRMFDKPQHGYGRTMNNLAHRANQIAADVAYRKY